MINKKKVLFYGNCQLAVLSKMLQLQNPKFNEEYDVLKASDYNLAPIYETSIGTVAPFMYREHTEYGVATPETIKAVEQITEDADIIIFQQLHQAKHIDRPEEFTTDYIYQKHKANKRMICVPSFWFSGYLTNITKDNLVIPYILKWLLDKGLSNEQILYWLKNESHHNISLLIDNQVQHSIKEIKNREIEESFKYKDFVSILDILSEYKKIFLCYNMAHPSEYYFKKLYYKLIEIIDNNLQNEILEKNITVPRSPFFTYPLDFHWFKENYPNISNCDPKHYVNHLDKKFIDEQVYLIKKLDIESDFFKREIQENINILNCI
jgi:hypothetical protein